MKQSAAQYALAANKSYNNKQSTL